MEITHSAVVISNLILGFTIYSLIGWACESAFCSIPAKKFINRGFLNGPFCPIYGVGALLIVTLLEPFSANIPLLFIGGLLLTSLLEFITGFLLEKLFHTKWWDYSKRKFNIKGRVCLRNSLLFGLMAVVLMAFINPAVEELQAMIPLWLLPIIAFLLLFYFIADCVVTVRSILTLNGKLDELEKVLDEIAEKGEEEMQKLYQSFESKISATREALLELENSSKDRLRDRMETMSQTLNSGAPRRLLKAFPSMQSSAHSESILHMRETVKNRRIKLKAKKKQKPAK